jgi:hypothetical protein
MRALSSLLLAGAVGIGGLALAPATAQADGGWRGRDYYRSYAPPPPPRYYGYGYGGGYGYGPQAYYRPPPVYYRPPPPVFYRPPPPAFYAPPRAFYGAPRSYGIPPGPGVGLWMR